ncbi:1-(5-phosphoribosyl)-5-[(5-phosphoribosylamino)methylideneamino]imidazole-4-carboxamide isomerase [candidate division KSB1 bacterium]|nr:1-(5-phosphoribosyl)-5-[(5-phosphoribosylamino)methylideneamino]imidazole-4-carboxamide isomerase [candidate division KSB1 bacterium]NIR71012.1 1-(5-phosphoribosyl)-5-[(5-phosphoribosylamino)methylideneamino]imidazole-4-carboxamide isomerase [candidate division KSB1 bacterium]NIS26097.1 1-(5-phosphoribosyl)-5-[(5-phosphoribosylamino)methylideneamino]imidazole-4-carboxamide isomerase [candidate division KSB1 bacterium]NIT72891.1 1-(5-phosphoribosyl)-5-[(5-phosphoribosylamino)methylideneamino]i
MLVIPAIDIKDGKCVRLKQGEFSQQTIYMEDPLETALNFQQQGAKMLHVVDLDGAKEGHSLNNELIQKLTKAVKIPIQLGGGIRSLKQIGERLNWDVDRVIIGTLAIKQPNVVKIALEAFGGEKILLGVDAREGKVAVEGWQQNSELTAMDLVETFKLAGLSRVIYTDISRDGMLSGPNIRATKQIAVKSGLKVTASGGISSKEDLDDLGKLEPFGVDSAIVGRAFYERRILPEEVF